jgi:hypothetical protein
MTAFKNKVVKGEVKINASTLFPYQCYNDAFSGKSVDIINAQWKALPDYINGDHGILPMIDVSGSMSVSVDRKQSTTCLAVAVSLGLYVAERQTGAFNNLFLTFSSTPTLVKVEEGSLSDKLRSIIRAHWGMSTDINKAFQLILSVAIEHKVSQKDMPKYLLILSDMQFDQCASLSGYEMAKTLYKEAGYEIPRIVFWNLNSNAGNVPVKAGKEGVALVSGFSPSIMKSVLSDAFEKFTPENLMLDAIMNDRYAYV